MSKHSVTVRTTGRGFFEITREMHEAVEAAGVEEGVCHCFIHHTSASLVIMENADPDVLVDLARFMDDLAPDGDSRYRHTAEGPDDMPAHVRSALTLTSLCVPVTEGRLDLGTWQGVFVWEHRHRAHQRRVTLNVR